MGSRQLTRQLRRLGFEMGRLHVRTLMLRMGIQAMAPQPGSSKQAPGHKVYPYLLRHVVVDRSNQVWALDTTYIPMRQAFVYLTAIVDVATRQCHGAQGGHHAAGLPRRRNHARRPGPIRCLGNRQPRTGQPIHGRGLHSSRARVGRQALHGRAWRLARQRVCGASVAQCEVRAPSGRAPGSGHHKEKTANPKIGGINALGGRPGRKPVGNQKTCFTPKSRP